MEDTILDIDTLLQKKQPSLQLQNRRTIVSAVVTIFLFAYFVFMTIYRFNHTQSIIPTFSLVPQIPEFLFLGLFYIGIGLRYPYNPKIFDLIFVFGTCIVTFSILAIAGVWNIIY
jgi:predicted neutral ceramidase superfamily lipid hydrolase